MGIIDTASLAPLPPPLRGRVGEGGSGIGTARVAPLPQPLPAKGRGARAHVLTLRVEAA